MDENIKTALEAAGAVGAAAGGFLMRGKIAKAAGAVVAGVARVKPVGFVKADFKITDHDGDFIPEIEAVVVVSVLGAAVPLKFGPYEVPVDRAVEIAKEILTKVGQKS
jgi:hypothetical protein